MTSYVNHALATKSTSPIKLLFKEFIVHIMKNFRAKLGCHVSNNNRDKEGGGFRPLGIEFFKTPRSDRVKEPLQTVIPLGAKVDFRVI